jgi:hypothetical protein
MKKRYLNYIIGVLLLFNIFTLFKLNNLENSIDRRFQDYVNAQNSEK